MLPQHSTLCNKQAQNFSWPSPSDLSKLSSASLVTIAAASTAPSITASPEALGNSSTLAGGRCTAAEYRRLYGCGVNARPRLRALAVSDSLGTDLLIDLDMAPGEPELQCLMAVLLGTPDRVVVTHESEMLLGFALHTFPELRIHSQVIDLAVVVRTLRPGLPYALSARAAGGEEAALALVGKNPTTLDAMCCAVGTIAPKAVFQSGREWNLCTLSSAADDIWYYGDGHAQALRSRLGAIQAVWSHLAGSGSIDKQLENLARAPGGEEFLSVFAKAPAELARIHAHGMPVSMSVVEEIETDAFGAVRSLAGDLVESVPRLTPLFQQLLSSDNHATAEVRRILGGYASACGHPLPCDDDGLPKVGSDAATLHGAADLPGLVAWYALEDCKRQLNAAVELRRRSKLGADGVRRIHPLMRVGAVSGRTTCSLPNAQGLDERTKRAIEAPPGYVLIEADFGAIEIRIAAAQAARSMTQAAEILSKTTPAPEWITKALERAASSDEALAKPGATASPWEALAYWYQRALRSGMPMIALLREGRCPHDYTALGLAERAGMIDLPGPTGRMECLRTLPRAELRSELGDKRKAAKVVNLGLLYRMSAKGLWIKGILGGLDWTKEEARTARDDWYEQFPELAFSTELCLTFDREMHTRPLVLPVRYGKGTKLCSQARLHRSTTLGGRPVVTHDDRIINLRAQGTGATLILKSIADLPETTKQHIIMAVHDSVLLCVPAHLRDLHAAELSASMSATATEYLGAYGVPAVVDVETGPNWGSLTEWRIAP